MEWVKQKHTNGCGPAVLAMLTGEPYDTFIAEINSQDWHGHKGDWDEHGITHISLDRILVERGWFLARKYKWEGIWPPRLWAPLHFASVVQPSGNHHFVAIDEEGRILDPIREGYYDFSNWPEVNNVVGCIHP